MKKLILLLSATVLMLATASAQKMAHFNRDSLMMLMPETKAASTELEIFVNDLTTRVKSMQAEYDTKVKEFNDLQAKGSSKLILDNLAADIQGLDKRIQEFQMSAQNEIQKKRDDLLKPIMDKINASVKKIAKANKYVYVIDTSRMGEALVYAEESYNIFGLIKKDLNLSDPPKTDAPKGQ